MDIQDFKKVIKEYDLSEKAQNVLLVNGIDEYAFFLNVNVKKLYFTEKRFRQTIDELLFFQNMLKRKSEEIKEEVQCGSDSIDLIKKKNNRKKEIGSTAIKELIGQKGLPQKKQNIIQHLAGEFTEDNITANLPTTTKLINVGNILDNGLQAWKNQSCKNLIKLLPDQMAEFAQYFVNLNKTSYTLVMAFIFICKMDKRGSIHITQLKDMFYDFYLDRHKKSLVIEAETAVMSRIGTLTKNEVLKDCVDVPFSHFLFSEYFQKSFRNQRLFLKYTFRVDFTNALVRDKMIIILFKAIEDYYQKISHGMVSSEQNPETQIETQESDSPKSQEPYCTEILSDDPVMISIDNSVINDEKSIESKKDKRDELIHFIKNTDLSVRAINVILNNCSSVKDCYLLSGKKLLACQNCGRKTSYEILDFIKQIKLEGDFIPPPTIKEQLGTPPTENSLSILPIFSSTKLDGLTLEDLHADFNANSMLSDWLILSVRIKNVLDDMGLKTVGDVILTPESEFLKQQNCGKKSLKKLKKQLHSFYLSKYDTSISLSDNTNPIDFTSYEDMVLSFIAVCVKNIRNQKIFQNKFCFQSEKIPTLEELGQIFGITRERVRQIVKRELRKLKHRVNINKLEHFWREIDSVVSSGGGIIHLGELPVALQTKFNWPTAPNYLALGQWLALRRHSEDTYKNDRELITSECECPSCEQVLKQLNIFIFSDNKSYHVEVLAKKLKDYCLTNCPWQASVKTFHKAYIEHLVNQTRGSLRLQEDVVMSRDHWIETYCNKLEDVACYILETQGKPMHFREIAFQIRRKNIHFKELSDHNLHASIGRYDRIKITSRGTFGLGSWELKSYRSVSTAIEEFIDGKGLPQRRQHIIQHLAGEFNEGNITAALSLATRFKSVGDGIYDRQQNWLNRTLDELEKGLPDPVAEFAQYLTRRNNTSYKLVMALIFIRSMDEQGAIYLFKLKEMFYNFYLSRHKKGLTVEIDTAAMSLIGELTKGEAKNKTCKEPLKSFLKSNYFIQYSQNGRKIKLVGNIFFELDRTIKYSLLIFIFKAIDNYFQLFFPETIPYVHKPQMLSQESESISEGKSPFPMNTTDTSTTTLNIKKKRRGKIKL